MIRRSIAPLVLAAALPGGLVGQEVDTLGVDSVRPIQQVEPVAVDTPTLPASPVGAMLRSMVLPGWGQSKFESYFRGSVYFTGWAGNWFMIFRNEYRLDNAQVRFEIRTDQIEDQLVASSTNPDSLRAQIDSFPDILDTAVREDSLGNALRKLARARKQQREDWIAWSLFWVLASGVDAFVTAHLADFPADVEMRPTGERALSLSVSVPFSTPGAPPPRAAGAALPAPPLRGPPAEGGMQDSR
ncbi:MAG: DUF5683 domain-containing protein [Longimicrobiales bacterium]